LRFVPSYEKRASVMVRIVAILAILATIDAVSTLLWLSAGHAEANPFSAAFMGATGVLWWGVTRIVGAIAILASTMLWGNRWKSMDERVYALFYFVLLSTDALLLCTVFWNLVVVPIVSLL